MGGPGLLLNVEAVSAPADGTVTLTILATDSAGNPYADLTTVTRLSAMLAYPAAEYEFNIRENMLTRPEGAMLVNNGDGTYDYTFAEKVPAGSLYTFAAGLEGRVEFDDGSGNTLRQGTATNGIGFFVQDDNPGEPIPRRAIVDTENCNQCHDDLRAHGGSRVGADYCVMCHNTTLTDIDERDDSGPEYMLAGAMTVSFKDMIHRIHTGEELHDEYTVLGHNQSIHDFTEVRFPGRRQKCDICHIEDAFEVPLLDEVLSTSVDNGDTVVEVMPERAACTSCHDSFMTNIHAVLNTDPGTGVETCAVCHGPGAEFAVHEALAP
jgi:OmcA/MtrC family decaheme c-type cytochrome